jgi:prepilin-type N-terminal cleavage/methylation domain-containing protein
MLKKLKKSDQDGFTIIEVMIVLAIAALILLIVFLAVPALQRSSRNTQRKNDAANISSQISSLESNNNGKLPSGVAAGGSSGSDTSKLEICSSGGNSVGSTSSTCASVSGTSDSETVNLGYYTSDNIAFADATSSGLSGGSSTISISGTTSTKKPDQLAVITGATCNGNSVAVGNSRQIAIVYWIEGGTNGSTEQCTTV